MSNFSVTVTEILGTDSMNNSRVTINNNFRTLATAINNISNLVSSNQIGNATTIDFYGKSATIGNIVISNDAIQNGSTALDANDFATLRTIIDDYLQQNTQTTQTA